MASQRILRGAPATITTAFQNQHGEPRAVAGDITVELIRSDGTEVTGITASTDADTNVVSVEVPTAATTQLDWLNLTATATDGATSHSTVEIVGAYYFSLVSARGAEQSLREKIERYPDPDLFTARQQVEEECESICGRAFVPRYGKVKVRAGDAATTLSQIPDLRTTRAITIDSTKYTGTALSNLLLDWNHPSGYNRWRYGETLATLEFEFGMDGPPADLQRAAIIRLRNRLNIGISNYDPRAISISNEMGTTTLFTPGLRGAHTGLPEVDEVYARYSWNTGDVLSVPVR